MENMRPLRAELPAVWSDISMRGFKVHALNMLVLDELLGLELSNFSRQLKLKPGIDDDHRVIVAMSNDLWFRAMKKTGESTRRKNSLEYENDRGSSLFSAEVCETGENVREILRVAM